MNKCRRRKQRARRRAERMRAWQAAQPSLREIFVEIDRAMGRFFAEVSRNLEELRYAINPKLQRPVNAYVVGFDLPPERPMLTYDGGNNGSEQ